MERGKCADTEITAGDAVFSLQMPLELKPGEKKEFIVLLGVVPKRDARRRTIYAQEAAKAAAKYLDIRTVDRRVCGDVR